MRELTQHQVEEVSGGVAWLAVVAGVYLVGNVIDVLYNAAGAFSDGYNANDHQ